MSTPVSLHSPSGTAAINHEEKAGEDAPPLMVSRFCPQCSCSQVGAALPPGAGELLMLALSSLQGGLPRPCLGGDAGQRLGHKLSPEPCAPCAPLGQAGNAEDLLLQALQQSCLEDHLLEATWVVDAIAPGAPGEAGRMGVLCLAGLCVCVWGGEQGGQHSPRGGRMCSTGGASHSCAHCRAAQAQSSLTWSHTSHRQQR